MADQPRHHRRLHGAHARRAVAGEALENVRLLIFGGEACPPELAERLAVDGREVWNTYGPTEATVVACAALLGGPARSGSGCRWTAGTSPSSTPTALPVAEGGDRRTDHRRRRPGPLPRPGEGRREVRPDAVPGLGPRLPLRRPGPATKPRA